MERGKSNNHKGGGVLERIEDLQGHIEDVLGQLIRIPSVSPNYPGVNREEVIGGEARCNEALSEFYKQIGCQVDLWEEEAGRANLVGVLKGVGGGKSLIFNGHIDTVPPGSHEDWKWNDPYSGNVEDGKLYGIGAADMKGGIVAQYAAAKALVDCGFRLKGDLILESVVGEETMDHHLGTSATIKRGYRADAAIVSEPTSITIPLAICPASPGLLFMKVTCPGVATHPGFRYQFVRAGGAGSNAGVNAVEKGVLILKALQDLEYQWGFSKKHPLFPDGYFTLHPGVIVGGPPGPLVPYIVSTYCRIEYIIWYPPQESVEDVKNEITDYIMKVAGLDPWLAEHRPSIEWVNHWPPHEIDQDHPLVQACVTSREEIIEDGTQLKSLAPLQALHAVDDATFLNQAGIPAITCGPGAEAHRLDEFVTVDELVAASKFYALTAMAWCGTT